MEKEKFKDQTYFLVERVSSNVKNTAMIEIRRNNEMTMLGKRYSNLPKNFAIAPKIENEILIALSFDDEIGNRVSSRGFFNSLVWVTKEEGIIIC